MADDTVIHNPETGEELYLVDGQWKPSTLSDIKKTAVPSLIRGATQAVTAPKESANLAGRVVDWAANKWLPEGSVDMIHGARDAADKVLQYHPVYRAMNALPDYQTAINKVQEHTGPLYEAQRTGGKYVQNALEFLPGAVAGPGGLLRNAGKGIAAGLASEGAGQATAGGPLEPYARAAGAIAGSGVRIPRMTKELAPEQVFRSGIPTRPMPYDQQFHTDLATARQNFINNSGRAGHGMPQGSIVGDTLLQMVHGPSGQPMASGNTLMSMAPNRYHALRQDMGININALQRQHPREAAALGELRNAMDSAMGRHISNLSPNAYGGWEQARQAITPGIRQPSPLRDALWNLGSAGAAMALPGAETATRAIFGHMIGPEVRQMVGALRQHVLPHVTQFDPKLTARILATQGPMNAPLPQP